MKIITLKINYDQLIQFLEENKSDKKFRIFINNNFQARLTDLQKETLQIFLTVFLLKHVHINRDRELEFITVSSKYLQGIVSKYKPYINLLIGLGVLKPRKNKKGKESYKNGKGIERSFTKAYRFSKKFLQSAELVGFTIKIQKNIDFYQNFLGTFLTNDRQRVKKTSKASRFQASKLNALSIDMPSAKEKYLKSSEGEERFNWIHHIVQAYLFNNSDKSYNLVDSFGKRIYNQITWMKNGLLEFIRGEEFIELDLRNSQLQCFIKIMENDKSDDTIEFIELVKNGEIYEMMMDEFDSADKNYKKFKSQLFEQVFYSNKKRYPLTKEFQNRFPNVFEAILTEKREYYKDFPKKLQRIESDFFIKIYYNKVIHKYPDRIFITKHDSALIPRDIFDECEMIFLEEFRSYFGYDPSYRSIPVNFEYDESENGLNIPSDERLKKNVQIILDEGGSSIPEELVAQEEVLETNEPVKPEPEFIDEDEELEKALKEMEEMPDEDEEDEQDEYDLVKQATIKKELHKEINILFDKLFYSNNDIRNYYESVENNNLTDEEILKDLNRKLNYQEMIERYRQKRLQEQDEMNQYEYDYY